MHLGCFAELLPIINVLGVLQTKKLSNLSAILEKKVEVD